MEAIALDCQARLGEKTLTQWPVSKIKIDPLQPRCEFDARRLHELARSLASVGQLAPIIGYPDPHDPATLIVVDGERRLRAARTLDTPFETLDAIVLAGPPSPAELLLVQLSINQCREQLSARELCAAYAKLIADLKITQGQLAVRLGISESKVSKVLSRERILPELQAQADRLEASVIPILAQLTPEGQRATMAFAGTEDNRGKLPTREQVQAYVEAMRPKKPTPRRPSFEGRWDGRGLRIGLKPDDSHDTLIEGLKTLITLVHKNRNIPLANLSLLLDH